MSSSAFDHAVQAKVALIYQDPACVAADNVNQNTISLVEPEGNGVVVTGTAQPALAVIVPGVQGPSGTAFEEIPLNKLAPGALPSGITVASANIVDGTIVNADINAAAGIVDTKLATISTAGKVSNSATTATASNTASAIVARDASGNFTANVITADLAGKSDSTDELENGLTFNNLGSGIASGTEFDGTVATTVSYNSVGAAAAGHSHANLIFVPVGANDTALAAAFTDAAANDKKIVFSEDTTVKIPTVAATIQAVCELVVPTVNVEILIESGHEINNSNLLQNGDYSRFTISSEDAEALVGTSLAGDLGVVQCVNATAPVWNFILDCDGKADYGLYLISSRGWIKSAKGVKRSRRANLFVHHASNLGSEVISGVGAVLSDGQGHGAWVTWGSSAQLSFANAQNNAAVRTNDFAFFVSRGTHLMIDRTNMSGSSNGIRCARSIVCARDTILDNIPALAVVCFELGFVSLSRASFVNCGGSSFNNAKAILQVGIGDDDRNQSGGQINAENATFDDANADIARVIGGDGYINLDNATGTGIGQRVAVVGWGTITSYQSSFATAASNDQNELITVSRGGKFQGFASTFDGGATVRNVARVIGDGFVSLDSCVGTNFTENTICRLEDSGTCYARSASHNGSADIMQRGTNANGEFVRFNNGMQECWAWLEMTTISTDGKLMARTWVFPAAFINPVSSVVVTGAMSVRNPSNQTINSTRNKLKDAQLLSSAVSVSGSEFFVEINSTATTTFVTGDTCWIRAHAIGRWF
jgi:hypothetical protein